jgi:SAM-dependent methyltransferase
MCSTLVVVSAGTRCSLPSTASASRRSTAPSPALDFAHREAASRGLQLRLCQADAGALPFDDESFDYVLSWNVIFHGTMGDVGRRLAEIWRVLKPGRLHQCTMLSKAPCAIRLWPAGRPRHLHPWQRPQGTPTLLLRLGGPCHALRRLRASVPDPRGAASAWLLALAHPRRTAVKGDAHASAIGTTDQDQVRDRLANGRYRRREAT